MQGIASKLYLIYLGDTGATLRSSEGPWILTLSVVSVFGGAVHGAESACPIKIKNNQFLFWNECQYLDLILTASC